jgi:hypothetical protein
MVVASSEDPERIRLALQGDLQRKNLAGDILRNKALEAIVNGARPVDEEGNEVDLTIAPPVTTQVVEAEAVDADLTDVVEAEVVEAEVIASNEEE